MQRIEERLKRLEEKIEAACAKAQRSRDEIRLVVVTKSARVEEIKEIIKTGYYQLGENRVGQLKSVSEEIEQFLNNNPNIPAEKVNWHMIGHLQRNKVKQVLPLASLIHSVDTLRLAEEINDEAEKMWLCPRILLQVNSSGEVQKFGVPAAAAIHLAEQIATLKNVSLVGIMTMAPLTMDKFIIKQCFSRAREIFDEIKREKIGGSGFKHISMGMSQDFEEAIAEGATILRIGSAIFSDF